MTNTTNIFATGAAPSTHIKSDVQVLYDLILELTERVNQLEKQALMHHTHYARKTIVGN